MSDVDTSVVVAPRIMGLRCTFSGPFEHVVMRSPPTAVVHAMLNKGASQAEARKPRPCCPYCGFPVGAVEARDFDSAMEGIARASGQSLEKLMTLYEWAAGQDRCFSGAVGLARAYEAHLKRERKRARQR